jgi:SAM-dependent methyltransferase
VSIGNYSSPREIFREPTDDRAIDPLAGSPWSRPDTVAGFSRSEPNPDLIEYASRRAASGMLRVLDLGCGAGRNAVPLAQLGHAVTGVDLSWPMLAAASARGARRLRVACAPMDALPVRDRSFDLIVAHGIWNLARSGREFRAAIHEAARAAAPAASLFVFTFSRRTLDPDARPVDGETFVFTQFSGAPQVFLTASQLCAELAAVGFAPDPDLPMRELNVPPPGAIRSGAPVIFQAGFRFTRE